MLRSRHSSFTPGQVDLDSVVEALRSRQSIGWSTVDVHRMLGAGRPPLHVVRSALDMAMTTPWRLKLDQRHPGRGRSGLLGVNPQVVLVGAGSLRRAEQGGCQMALGVTGTS